MLLNKQNKTNVGTILLHCQTTKTNYGLIEAAWQSVERQDLSEDLNEMPVKWQWSESQNKASYSHSLIEWVVRQVPLLKLDAVMTAWAGAVGMKAEAEGN